MASQDLNLPPIITLPNPDPITINLYTNTVRDANIRKFEELMFRYKINPITAERRQEYVKQIIEVTSDAQGQGPYYISLYDLALVWGTIRNMFLPSAQQPDPEEFLTFHVQTTSDEALRYIIKTSLVDAMYKPNLLSDIDLREALNICSQVNCGYDIQRRLFKQIQYNTWHKFYGTNWYLEGNNVDNISSFVNWIVYGLEQRPAVLWIIEYVLIRYGTGHWYNGPESEDVDITVEEIRAKGRVQGLCYILDTLKKILTDPAVKLPESLLKNVDAVYRAMLNTQFKINSKSKTNTLSFDKCKDVIEKSEDFVAVRKEELKRISSEFQSEIDVNSDLSLQVRITNALNGLLNDAKKLSEPLEDKLNSNQSELDKLYKLFATNPASIKPGTISNLVAQIALLSNIIPKTSSIHNKIRQLYEQYSKNIPGNMSLINELEHNMKEVVTSYSKVFPHAPALMPSDNTFNILREWSQAGVSSRSPQTPRPTSPRRSPSPPSRPPPSRRSPSPPSRPLSSSQQQLSTRFLETMGKRIQLAEIDNQLGHKAVELTEKNLLDELQMLQQLISMSNEASNTNTPNTKLVSSIAAQSEKARNAKQMVDLAKEYKDASTKYLNMIYTPESANLTTTYDLSAKMDALQEQLKFVPGMQKFINELYSTVRPLASSSRLTGKQRRAAKHSSSQSK